eukprot:3554785-Amphidinium_carterae.2
MVRVEGHQGGMEAHVKVSIVCAARAKLASEQSRAALYTHCEATRSAQTNAKTTTSGSNYCIVRHSLQKEMLCE